MNVIFTLLILISLTVLTINNPAEILPSMTDGVEKSVTLTYKLLLIYSVWSGVFEVIKSGGISRLLAKLLSKPIAFIFGKCDKETTDLLTANVTANALGLGGVATPCGIRAESLLEKSNNKYAQSMLFVVATTSLQLLPVSVIGLRSYLGSASAQDILLPTVLTSAVSNAVGITLTKIFCKK